MEGIKELTQKRFKLFDEQLTLIFLMSRLGYFEFYVQVKFIPFNVIRLQNEAYISIKNIRLLSILTCVMVV